MLDDSNLNKTAGKYRTAEGQQTIDNCTVNNKFQLVKLIRKNATTCLDEKTFNKFNQQGKLNFFFKLSLFKQKKVIIIKISIIPIRL